MKPSGLFTRTPETVHLLREFFYAAARLPIHDPESSPAVMSILNSIRAQVPPVHAEGYPFIGIFALASLVLFWVWTPLGWIGTGLTVWCALFFRDPKRVTPVRDGLVVSPADGRVSMVVQIVPPAELGLAPK